MEVQPKGLRERSSHQPLSLDQAFEEAWHKIEVAYEVVGTQERAGGPAKKCAGGPAKKCAGGPAKKRA
eukprot:11631464-Prorocentrum_lima.AAC.1